MRNRKTTRDRLVLAAVILFIAGFIIFAGATRVRRKAVSPVSKVSLGQDQVFCTREATMQDALSLGEALRGTGYFHNSGASVLLSKHGSVKQISFALEDGAWDHPATVAAFEEIGRRVATSIGGFPIQIELADSRFAAHRSLKVGKVLSGSNDVVYYFGAATENEAIALALSLTDARYFGGSGATVAIWKDGRAAIGYVVNEGVWNRPDAVNGFADPRVHPVPIPQAPKDDPTGIDHAPPVKAEELAVQVALPEGSQKRPTAGFLYFGYTGRASSTKSVELVYKSTVLKLK